MVDDVVRYLVFRLAENLPVAMSMRALSQARRPSSAASHVFAKYPRSPQFTQPLPYVTQY